MTRLAHRRALRGLALLAAAAIALSGGILTFGTARAGASADEIRVSRAQRARALPTAADPPTSAAPAAPLASDFTTSGPLAGGIDAVESADGPVGTPEAIAAEILDPDGQTYATTLPVPRGMSADAFAASVEHRAEVVRAAPTRPLAAHAAANDALRRSSTARPDWYGQWALDHVPYESTWDPARGDVDGSGVVVAVVDTGVDASHPDLAGRVLPGANCAKNGPCTAEATPIDPGGHGTHVAGIIAATADDSMGIAGGAPGAVILPVRVLSALGTGEEAWVANGIDWAVSQGADVINLSLGVCVNEPGYTRPECAPAGFEWTLLEQAVADAIAAGVVVVASAGNDSIVAGTAVSIPAAYDDVIAVGAIDPVNEPTWFTSTGTWVDIAAPGVFILSTASVNGYSCTTGTRYAWCSGTSMAAPYVSAAAALVLDANPAADVAAALIDNASAIDPTYAPTVAVGAGLVNPLASVRAATGDTPWPTPAITGIGRTPNGPFNASVPLGTNETTTLVLEGEWLTPTDGTDFAVSFSSGALGIVPGLAPTPDLLDTRVRIPVRATNAPVGPVTVTIETSSGTTSCVDCIDVMAAPVTPTGVTTSNVGQTSFTVNWSAVGGASTYRVSTANSIQPTLVEGGSGPSSPLVITGAVRDLEYSAHVQACNASGACSPAGITTVTTLAPIPDPPSAIWSWWITETSAEVDWNSDAPSFEVSINGAASSIEYQPWISLYNLTPATSYTVAVAACSSGGCSSTVSTTFTTASLPPPPPPPPPPPVRSGYWMLDESGSVYAFGDAPFLGAAQPFVAQGAWVGGKAADIEPNPANTGYWVLDSLGRVQPFGDVWWMGDTPSLPYGEHAVSMSSTPSGTGYWIFTNRARVFSFGDAPYLGDLSHIQLNGPIVSSIPTPTGQGYYMVASDGGIFTFGDASFRGSMGGQPLNAPVVGLVPTASNQGYWLVASDGGIFAFGDADFRGSMGGTPLNQPVTGMLRFGNGYLMVAADGGIFTFSDRQFHGSLGSNPPPWRVVTAATTG